MTTHRTALNWIKSSFSGSFSNCVQVAADGGCVLVGNSRQPGGPKLVFTPGEFSAFLAGCKAGEFDTWQAAMTEPAIPPAVTAEAAEVALAAFTERLSAPWQAPSPLDDPVAYREALSAALSTAAPLIADQAAAAERARIMGHAAGHESAAMPAVIMDGDLITIEWSGELRTVVVCCKTPVTLRDLTPAEADQLAGDPR